RFSRDWSSDVCSSDLDRPEKNQPTQTVVERYIQLKACMFVDEIVPYTTEQDLEDILRSFKIDVRILGEEYKDKNFTGRDYCEERSEERRVGKGCRSRW